MFRGAEHIFLDHPVKGVGLGTIVTVFPGYDTGYDGLVVDHVHNDYIEALAETGTWAASAASRFFGCWFTGARRSFVAEQGHFSTALHAAAIAAVCGILLHSFVDFNLHIPSNAFFFCFRLTWQPRRPFLPVSSCRDAAFAPANMSSPQMTPTHLWDPNSGELKLSQELIEFQPQNLATSITRLARKAANASSLARQASS